MSGIQRAELRQTTPRNDIVAVFEIAFSPFALSSRLRCAVSTNEPTSLIIHNLIDKKTLWSSLPNLELLK
ncbi:MAG: hypothetical protein HW389_869, partial [Bacteroidetes bacterium]|nr:hypothetical protein [Bacteroidota bacterium]